jgi:hypothetical protein
MSTLDEMLNNFNLVKDRLKNYQTEIEKQESIVKDTSYYLKIYRDYIHYILIENKKLKKNKLPEHEILNFSEWRAKQNETNNLY